MTDIRNGAKLGFQTRAIHHGYTPSMGRGAVAAPVYMTSTYADAPPDGSNEQPFVYGRQHNPTQQLLEERLAELEGAEAALVLASGMAAISSLLLTILSAGDEIIVHRTVYSTVSELLTETLPRFGIKVVRQDLSAGLDPGARAKLVYFEAPVNPLCEVLDIKAVARAAHEAGLRVVVDSTFASPALQRPLALGADFVVHSLTKYINGHGDLLGGAVLGDAETLAKVRKAGLRYITGATLSPMSCFLVLRGLKTLHLRMRQHSGSALAIATMLAGHPAVGAVRYPFLPADPAYPVARRQMTGGSGMLSFCVRAGFDAAVRVMQGLTLVSRAVSLGDAESLVMHPGGRLAAARQGGTEYGLGEGITMDLLRLSVGLEDAEDLIADLHQALDSA